jgi:IstB-like ATP binding protein
MSSLDALHARAKVLKRSSCTACWHTGRKPPLPNGLNCYSEEQERGRRSLERRPGAVHIGRFKPLCDFDWTWPKRCDRSAFEALMALEFLDRLIHNAEILAIEGESYRLKEAQERSERRAQKRRRSRS